MRYLVRSKISRNLVHKKIFRLIRLSSSQNPDLTEGGNILILSLNQLHAHLNQKLRTTIILGNFVNNL